MDKKRKNNPYAVGLEGEHAHLPRRRRAARTSSPGLGSRRRAAHTFSPGPSRRCRAARKSLPSPSRRRAHLSPGLHASCCLQGSRPRRSKAPVQDPDAARYLAKRYLLAEIRKQRQGARLPSASFCVSCFTTGHSTSKYLASSARVHPSALVILLLLCSSIACMPQLHLRRLEISDVIPSNTDTKFLVINTVRNLEVYFTSYFCISITFCACRYCLLF